MTNFIIVGLGGFIGCCLRYGVTLLFPTAIFPFATLISNICAGFLIGIYLGIEGEYQINNESLSLFIKTGMLGGLSTFSSFNIETINLFENGHLLHAGGNILFNVTLSLIGAALGLFLIRLIAGNR